MFVDATARQERTTESVLRTAIKQYSANYDSWFDGTIDSVEKRLRSAQKIAHQAGAAFGRTGASQYLSTLSDITAEVESLRELYGSLVTGGQDREAEKNPYDNPARQHSPGWEQVMGGPEGYVHTFKDPYGAGVWVSKSDPHGNETERKFHPSPRRNTPINPYMSLESQGLPPGSGGREAAWVEKEAHLFVADNREADRDEMYTRAKGHAEYITSAMEPQTSRAIVGAFVKRCMDLHIQRPARKVAATPPLTDFDTSLIYLP